MRREIIAILLFAGIVAGYRTAGANPDPKFPIPSHSTATPNEGHSNNWAVLVGASRFWYNYRHASNAMALYRDIKRLGIPDSQIILMMADDMACNCKNTLPGRLFDSPRRDVDLYGSDIQVDYRGYEVQAETFLRLLTGRPDDSLPRNKRLLTDAHSNILIYISGHGGDRFIKFQDRTEMSAGDLADAIDQMHALKRYNEIMFIVDTCQATTLNELVRSPDIFLVGSSARGENSLSYTNDGYLGISTVDRFSHFMSDSIRKLKPDSNTTILDILHQKSFSESSLGSQALYRGDLLRRSPAQVKAVEFFASVTKPVVVEEAEVTIDMDETEGGALDLLSLDPPVARQRRKLNAKHRAYERDANHPYFSYTSFGLCVVMFIVVFFRS